VAKDSRARRENVFDPLFSGLKALLQALCRGIYSGNGKA
jgi:hypothetical protein